MTELYCSYLSIRIYGWLFCVTSIYGVKQSKQNKKKTTKTNQTDQKNQNWQKSPTSAILNKTNSWIRLTQTPLTTRDSWGRRATAWLFADMKHLDPSPCSTQGSECSPLTSLGMASTNPALRDRRTAQGHDGDSSCIPTQCPYGSARRCYLSQPFPWSPWQFSLHCQLQLVIKWVIKYFEGQITPQFDDLSHILAALLNTSRFWSRCPVHLLHLSGHGQLLQTQLRCLPMQLPSLSASS